MIQYVHEHIIEEIKTNTKTDTIFVLASILLNLITLAINSAIAGDEESADIMIMIIFVLLVAVVNFVAILGLLRGRKTREKLVQGLLKMYEDNNVSGYYDISILEAHKTRYMLFLLVILSTGAVAIIVPFLML